ncbi:tetratricopeptide repeat protein [Streptomyces sp. NPDC058469]|uniref:tetratricopeptide repeat protein n=1 Tax=Streptomyces sp. NPDC058469 TaxID=3346514 RepID=UPI003648E273
MSDAMDGRADGHGRVYQASGDQHIIEHHHHGDASPAAWASTESVRQPTGGRAPVVLRDRTELMERLRAAVASDAFHQIYVLHGMGGCGKTAVARAVFQFASTEGSRVGLWVNAADRTTLRSGMLAVAADRGATEGELLAARNGLRASADLVWERLDRSAEPWLLVLDNADDPASLRDGSWLRTSPRGTVLVTTRQAAPRWWPHAELHHVGVLPRDAAAQVLYDLAPETGTMDEAAEIADRLGRLPLALTLAGGFLSHQVIDPWTMTRYGSHLAGHEPVDLIDRGANALTDSGSRHLVSQTWQLSLEALAAQGFPESTVLLRLMACYGADPLPLTLLNSPELNDVLPRSRAETALRGLLDQSLTTLVDVGVRCVQTHGVLLASVAVGTPHGQATKSARTAARLLDAGVPAIPEPGPQDLRLRLLSPHVLALLRHATDVSVVTEALDVAVRLAIALHRTGDYLSAWELASDAAAVAQPVLGAEHRLVLSSYARAGRALFRLGRYEESEALHRRVLLDRERLFGPDDPDTLDSYEGTSDPLFELSRVSEGLALLRHAAMGRQRVLGPTHPLTLGARALLLSRVPPSELAAEVDSTALPLPQECALELGPDHTVTLQARLNYANALNRLGRFEAAIEDARLVVEEYQRRYGPDFPMTLSAQTLYASIRAALGDVNLAVELMATVVDTRERILGAQHPFTAFSRRRLDEFRAKADHQSPDGQP